MRAREWIDHNAVSAPGRTTFQKWLLTMNDRYEREIDELLHRLEGRMRQEPLSRRVSRRFRPYSRGFRDAFAAFLRRPPAEVFMISAMGLVALSMVLNMFALSLWGFYAGLLSIVFFGLGIVLSVAGRHSPGYRKTWRGRELDYRMTGPSFWAQLRNWLRRRRL